MKKLREVRKEMNLNQTALAQKIGCTPQFVCMLEKGECSPSLAMAVKIDDVTGGKVPVHSWIDAKKGG
jgi:DNA-binding XRE family transcriptional regulator